MMPRAAAAAAMAPRYARATPFSMLFLCRHTYAAATSPLLRHGYYAMRFDDSYVFFDILLIFFC